KPCAREPHARFDGRELETEQRSDQGHGDEGHQGKPCGHQRLRDLPSMRVTAPALDPPTSPQSPQTTNPGSTTPGQQLDNAQRAYPTRSMVERVVAWTATSRGRWIKLRYLGVDKNHAWLRTRCAALNLRILINSGLTRGNG